MLQDTLKINPDTVYKQSTYFMLSERANSNDDTLNISFGDYIVNTLNTNLPPLKERPTLFKTKTFFVSKSMNEPSLQKTNSDSWIFGTLILIAVIYLLFAKSYPNKLNQIIKGCFSLKILNTVVKEGNFISDIIFYLFLFIFIPSFSLLCFALIKENGIIQYIPISSEIVIFLAICVLSLLVIFLKNILIYFFGLIFRNKNVINQYLTNQTIFYVFEGLILLPSLFFYFFLPKYLSEIIIISILIIIAILFVIRLFRGFYISLKATKFSKVYLFLYLCIVEILPLIIIFKLLVS
ncbi:MAG: hypothetical protein H6Q15_1329 [Bacteroidetes bacterium]|nr:hypothetical protein [Bacteroidota bacterium]